MINAISSPVDLANPVLREVALSAYGTQGHIQMRDIARDVFYHSNRAMQYQGIKDADDDRILRSNTPALGTQIDYPAPLFVPNNNENALKSQALLARQAQMPLPYAGLAL